MQVVIPLKKPPLLKWVRGTTGTPVSSHDPLLLSAEVILPTSLLNSLYLPSVKSTLPQR